MKKQKQFLPKSLMLNKILNMLNLEAAGQIVLTTHYSDVSKSGLRGLTCLGNM